MNKKAKREHRAVPHHKIVKMWGEGKSYEQIAKAIDRFEPKSDDPTKPCRAIISRMLNVGFKDDNGKVVQLKPRQGMRNIGVGTTVHKNKPKVAKVAKQPKQKTAKASKGKPGRKPGNNPILIEATDAGLIRVSVGKRFGLVPAEKAKVAFINVLDSLGFAVVPKETQVVAPASAVAETPTDTETMPAPETTPETAPTQDGDDVLETIDAPAEAPAKVA